MIEYGSRVKYDGDDWMVCEVNGRKAIIQQIGMGFDGCMIEVKKSSLTEVKS